jgi:phosphinothricin acetyltransferase
VGADVLIRLARAEDGPALAAIYAPAVAGEPRRSRPSRPTAARWRAAWSACSRAPPGWCSRSTARWRGYAYASPHRDRAAYQWSVEVSAYVAEAAHRRGVGRALYAALFGVLALQGFRNAYAGITLPNDASVGLHRALGFAPVGVYRGVGYKLGAWHDVAWFERALAPRDAEPSPPVPLADLCADPAGAARVEAALRAGPAAPR